MNSLSIVIPAYNEEQAIENIIIRTKQSVPKIKNTLGLDLIEVIVVNDGSRDRTLEIVEKQEGLKIISYPDNRGYGYAIKRGFELARGDIVGFLDADGTCDPNFFVQLCQTLIKEKADIALGCRLNPNSKMPLIRRIGNIAFAWLLTFFSSTPVRDTSSGMRVIRRSSLPKLMPLPDGLHFTPAMSARAILGDDLKIVEIDMPYQEREGRSKLGIIRDGIRFLRVILETAFLYKPSRPLGLIAFICLAIACALMIQPTLFYISNRSVKEWMIYRFIVSHFAGTSACLLFCASYLSTKIVDITLLNSTKKKKNFLSMFFSSRYFWNVPILFMLVGSALVLPSFLELVKTGATYEHWSRFIVMSFLISVAIILVTTRVVDYILNLIATRLTYLKSQNLI